MLHLLASARYSDWARPRFELQFEQSCSRYAFVDAFYRQFEKHHDDLSKYAISVFTEPRVRQGGLGDKLAGVANLVAFGIRTNRTVLIQADDGFYDAFRPRLRNLLNDSISWRDRNWAALKSNAKVFHITGCINPYRQKDEVHCKMEEDDYPQQVVKLRSNRCYLCRWTEQRATAAYHYLRAIGIDESTNLFDAAGCLLRLVMWPTQKLWDSLDEVMELAVIANKTNSSKLQYFQVGAHFRCGDIEYTTPHNVGNSCVVADIAKRYAPVTELLVDGTPVDEGECVRSVIDQQITSSPATIPIVYVTSDSPSAQDQIIQYMNWTGRIVKTPKGCHIEMDRSGSCSLETIVYWFGLALSDTIVVQGRQLEPRANYTIPSGFSRFAAIYGLNSKSLRFAQGCIHSESILQSRTGQGTWKCTDKPHFEDGALVRLSDQREIFVVRNQTRRSIPNWDTFVHEGFNLNRVQALSPDDLNQIPIGPSIKACTTC